MSVSARVSCVHITDYGSYKEVVMRPVVTAEDDDPNKSYSKWTPAGELKLSITNPDAFNYFSVGSFYNLSFTEHKRGT